MSAAKPQERGDLIRRPSTKRGHCSACEPTPPGRVSASDLYARLMAREGNGFVKVTPR